MMYHQKLLNMADHLESSMDVGGSQKTYLYPRNPVILSEDDWGVQSPPKRKVFRFHYHSQKVIGSLREL